MVIASEHLKTLLITSYFSFDQSNKLDNEALNDLIQLLGVISNDIQSCECESVVWTGVINTERKKKEDHSRTTQHCTVGREQMEELSLRKGLGQTGR